MKNILASVVILFFAGSSFGDELKIKVLSFQQANQGIHVGELCALVEGQLPNLLMAKVVPDENRGNPAGYNVPVGQDGKFCVAVVTFYGLANVSVWVPGQNDLKVSPVTAHMK